MAGRGTDIVLGGNVEKQIDFIRADATKPDEQKAAEVEKLRERVAGAARPGRRRRRAAHRRHRAPRVAPRRQPAARPQRPPGRPGLVALLPVARRSAAAHLRRRPRARDHGPAEDAGRRADRGRHRDALDRDRAAQGRGAQLRHPQAAARIRRRRERPAQGDLPAAQRAARGDATSPRRSRRCATACSPTSCASTCPKARSRSSGTCRASKRTLAAEWQLDVPLVPMLEGDETITDDDIARARDAGGRRAVRREDRDRRQAKRSAASSGRSCCRASTRTGASTSRRSTTCARASTCAATRRRIRSRNTSARRSSCSARCWTRSATRSRASS